MLRAHFVDLWLFLRRVSPNALGIFLVLLVTAAVLYGDDAWPGLSFMDCFVNAFYMMCLEAVELPDRWYLEMLILVLPVAGLTLAAEGLASATTLFLNKSQRQGEWNAVVASTYSGHTVVCGMGQLGSTLCTGLADAGHRVVAIELSDTLAPVVTARSQGIPVIIGDMTLPQTLSEANVTKARCIVVCSGDDLANIETSIVASEMAPDALVYARVFKKSLADRINAALRHDVITFSPYATAAERILEQMVARQAEEG